MSSEADLSYLLIACKLRYFLRNLLVTLGGIKLLQLVLLLLCLWISSQETKERFVTWLCFRASDTDNCLHSLGSSSRCNTHTHVHERRQGKITGSERTHTDSSNPAGAPRCCSQTSSSSR